MNRRDQALLMSTLVWLESTLQRSARLGLEVLERASKRKMVLMTPPETYTTDTSEDEAVQSSTNKGLTDLEEAFATIAEFMARTSYHCKKFYQAAGCTGKSNIEKKHVARFHKHMNAASPPLGKHGKRSRAAEDFYIEVAPGAYSVSASLPGSRQQTKMVDLNAGETVSLTFKL
ncbi:A-kinase-interacting protein 1 [Dunckerocampus dactyliophorus]|uniref:A-kinase-interacting protein 1 n=1 Tax=Dunckerocampus dactyliophorus TaxID=161453 RepID=UPI002404ADF2|nr:A-kinase-interacting protein 1 [Dunckerocampus dactyliophorus]